MNKKKIIIIVAAIACLGLFELFYFFVLKGGSKNDRSSSQSQQSSGSQNSSFPSGGYTQNSSKPPLGIKTNIAKANVVLVNDPHDEKSMRDAFLGFANAPSSDASLNWAEFYDNEKKHISLDTFSSSMGMKINRDVLNLLDHNNYAVFSCGSTDGMKNMGLYVNVRLMPDYKGDLYGDEIRFMKDWESTMLEDTKNILFPGIDFSEKNLQQKVSFKDGKYRYAPIILPGGAKSSLNYTILYDPIIISNSVDCLDKASFALYTPDTGKE